MLRNQTEAEQQGALARRTIEQLLKFAHKLPTLPQDVRPHVLRQRQKNLDKIENSAILYARRAFRFARLHIELTEHRERSRVPRVYRTISAA